MDAAPESRCLTCGNPSIDHVPVRYVIRAWFWHRFHRVVERLCDCSLGGEPIPWLLIVVAASVSAPILLGLFGVIVCAHYLPWWH